MKKTITLMIAMVCLAQISVKAQKVITTDTKTTTVKHKKQRSEYLSIGPVLGVDDNWVGKTNGDNKFKAGGFAGVGLIYTKQSHWGLGGKLLFSSEGYRVSTGDYTLDVTPLYLRMPLDVYYFFGNYKDNIRPKLFLGPSFGAKLTENYDIKGGDNGALESTTGPYKDFDFGLNAGAGLNIRLQQGVWLNLDLSYYQGLTDAVDDPAGRYNVNHNVGFSAGLLLGIR